MSSGAVPPYKPLKTARKSRGKGAALPQDEVLTAERECYFAKLARDQAEKDAKLALEQQEQEEIAQGAVFECGCCFDDVALSKMVPCMDAHLFCIDCARKNAENTLGNRGSVCSTRTLFRSKARLSATFRRILHVWTKMAAPQLSLMRRSQKSSRRLKCYFWRRSGPKRLFELQV